MCLHFLNDSLMKLRNKNKQEIFQRVAEEVNKNKTLNRELNCTIYHGKLFQMTVNDVTVCGRGLLNEKLQPLSSPYR